LGQGATLTSDIPDGPVQSLASALCAKTMATIVARNAMNFMTIDDEMLVFDIEKAGRLVGT
jgi:hypothetical protein